MRLCDDIRNQIRRDVQSAMNEARNKTSDKLDDNLLGYYDSGSPVLYNRTGTLLDASDVTPVTGAGGFFQFVASLDGGRISYSTGTFSGHQVLGATETGGFGNTLGNHGYWKRTQAEIPQIVDSAFSKKFG